MADNKGVFNKVKSFIGDVSKVIGGQYRRTITKHYLETFKKLKNMNYSQIKNIYSQTSKKLQVLKADLEKTSALQPVVRKKLKDEISVLEDFLSSAKSILDSTKQKRDETIKVAIIVALVIAVIAVIGFYIYKRNKRKAEK